MKAAALSRYAFSLPTSPEKRSTMIVEVEGRQRVSRIGIFLATVGQRRRTVYENIDGEVIVADACTCAVDWQPSLRVTRSVNCPIDQHSIAARSAEAAAA